MAIIVEAVTCDIEPIWTPLQQASICYPGGSSNRSMIPRVFRLITTAIGIQRRRSPCHRFLRVAIRWGIIIFRLNTHSTEIKHTLSLAKWTTCQRERENKRITEVALTKAFYVRQTNELKLMSFPPLRYHANMRIFVIAKNLE